MVDTERKILREDLIAGKASEQPQRAVEKKKGIDGKGFVAKLDECKSSEEIFALLHENMDNATLKDRVSKIPVNDLIVAFQGQKARCNASLGYRTSHEDLVLMAADKYQKMLEGNTGKKVSRFKIELAKYDFEKNLDKTPEKQIAMQIMASKKQRS